MSSELAAVTWWAGCLGQGKRKARKRIWDKAGNKIHLSSTFPFFLRATGSLTATPKKPSRYLPSNELQDFFSGCE